MGPRDVAPRFSQDKALEPVPRFGDRWKGELMKTCARFALAALSIASGVWVASALAHAQTLSGEALVKTLRQGGYVVVMRHASSPREVPDKEHANTDNVNLERQLDEAGRASAVAMGKALRDLRIPVGVVLTSPTYRALETVRLAKLPDPKPVPELGDGGQSMQGITGSASEWLQKRVTEFPSGTNTFLVTHMPNLTAAFPAIAAGVADGEALVFGPDAKGGATLIARIKIEEWPRMK
jgi:phosphohistidine phosphatase SixA